MEYDRRVRTVSGDGLIGRVSVIGAIGRELIDRHVDLVEQRLHLRGVAGILVRHGVCDDVAAVGIQRQVQLAPSPTGFCCLLFFQPLACTVDLQACTVDEDVEGPLSGRRNSCRFFGALGLLALRLSVV